METVPVPRPRPHTGTQREPESSHRGRPSIRIEEEQLRFLVEMDFRTVDTASLFGCLRRTIEQRIREYGISHTDFSNLSYSDLDRLVTSVVSVHPQFGEKSVSGR